MPDPSGGDADVIAGLFPVVVVIVVVLLLAGIGTALYRASRVVQQGHNPLTLDNDVAVRALDSQALAPKPAKATRLGELDRLLADGTISDAEHQAARARILAE